MALDTGFYQLLTTSAGQTTNCAVAARCSGYLRDWWAVTTSPDYLCSSASRRTLWKNLLPAFGVWLLLVAEGFCSIQANRDIAPQIRAYSVAFAIALAALGFMLKPCELRSDVVVSCLCGALVVTARIVFWNHRAPGIKSGNYDDSTLELPTIVYEFQCVCFMMVVGINPAVILGECAAIGLFTFLSTFTAPASNDAIFFIIFSCIGAWVDYTLAALFKESQDRLRSNNVLLDNVSDGFCTVDAASGIILSSSAMLEQTFGSCSLCGCSLQDIVDEQDHKSLIEFLSAAALSGPRVKAFLVSCHSPARCGAEVLAFEARIVPYAVSKEEISLCFALQGERRVVGAGGARPVADTAMPRSSALKPPSVTSAPAALMHATTLQRIQDVNEEAWFTDEEEAHEGGEGPMDCLPPWSKVRVQGVSGSQLMKRIDEIQVGDCVQCYDHLQQGLCYVAVTSLANESGGECDWVEANLADGTRLVMTADHPVRCTKSAHEIQDQAASGQDLELFGCRTVLGGDLTPAEDMLRVFKVEHIPVQDVRKYVDTAPRVSVGLAHSERYSMFVSSGANQPAVAVESGNYEAVHCSVMNTFIHARAPSLGPPSAASAPGKLWMSNVLRHGSSAEQSVGLQSTVQDQLSTVGDLEHQEGRCKPCRFQYQHQQDRSKPPCQNFEACGMCHMEHDEQFYRRYRTMANASRRHAKRQSKENDDHTVDGCPETQL